MNDTIDNYVRSMFLSAAPYDASHHDFAWQHRDLARMMSNECPIPPSMEVLDAVRRAAEVGHLYPYSGNDLRQALAEYIQVAPESIVLGNGSTEVLDVLVRLLVEPGDNTLIATPTYAYFSSQTRINGGEPRTVPLAKRFALDVDAILGRVDDRTKCIMLCSPNNPTGSGWSREEVVPLLDTGVPVMIDQAYLECGFAESFALLSTEYTNLVTARTMSKGFGLGGLRVGYLVGNPELMNLVSRVRIPFSLTLMSIWGCLAALEDPDYVSLRRTFISSEVDRLHVAMNQIPGVTAYPSDGNFVLADISGTGRDSTSIVDSLLEERMLIRAMSAHGLAGSHVRVTVGTVEQNTRFLELLSTLAGTGPSRASA